MGSENPHKVREVVIIGEGPKTSYSIIFQDGGKADRIRGGPWNNACLPEKRYNPASANDSDIRERIIRESSDGNPLTWKVTRYPR